MKCIALLSGGKDSVLSVMMAMRYGHFPVVIANMTPAPTTEQEGEHVHEVDSYMFQTVGHEVVEHIAHCMELPLRRSQVRRGQAKEQCLSYTEHPPEDDEVEEMYRLLKAVKTEFPDVQAVTTGAILSNYQRNRVERVCQRLGLVSLAYLWQRPASEVLDMVSALHMQAILVKTASVGLGPRKLLGKTLEQVRPTLQNMEDLYGSHMAGEGGEFETIVLDCPLFKKEHLLVRRMEVVMVDENDYSPSGHCILDIERAPKSAAQQQEDAAILARLLDRSTAGFTFPSDTMADLPSRQMLAAALARATASPQDTTDTGAAPCGSFAQTSLSTALKEGSTAKAFRTNVLESGTDYEAVADAFSAAHAWLKAEQLVPLVYRVACPGESWADVRAAFKATVPAISPPNLTAGFSAPSSMENRTVMVEILAAPEAAPSGTEALQMLHAQSLTYWAAGIPASFASQAFAATAFPVPGSTGIRLQLRGCCGVQGLDPATGDLVAATQHAELPEDLADDRTRRLAMEFGYAFASAAAYLRFLGVRGSLTAPEQGSQVTVLCTVTSETDASLAAALWAACGGREVAASSGVKFVCSVADRLPRDALVQLDIFCSQTEGDLSDSDTE